MGGGGGRKFASLLKLVVFLVCLFVCLFSRETAWEIRRLYVNPDHVK